MSRRRRHLYLHALLALMLFAGNASAARGEGAVATDSSQPDVRSGGVLEESYNYHRTQPVWLAGAEASSPLPSPGVKGNCNAPGGWYGYGFPVTTFRWGWFGAEHYYPTVWWHHGYYGDCCRHAYRRGY